MASCNMGEILETNGYPDLWTLWSPPVSLNQERHTQKCKATNFIFILFFFVTKICWKVPHENIHGEASILEIFQKKIKSPHFQEGKKKRVLKSSHFEEEKRNRFWNRWNLWRIWPNSKLSSFETRLWRAC